MERKKSPNTVRNPSDPEALGLAVAGADVGPRVAELARAHRPGDVDRYARLQLQALAPLPEPWRAACDDARAGIFLKNALRITKTLLNTLKMTKTPLHTLYSTKTPLNTLYSTKTHFNTLKNTKTL